ncbi:MAG: dTMP kinase [Gemmatimonadales bacterium]
MSAGCFVVVEGPEGAGKTTLATRLFRKMEGMRLHPVAVREPGGTPVAEGARRALLDHEPHSPMAEMFLFLAARADVVAGIIRPALAEGRVVLCDRYDLSTEAYQVAGRGIDSALFKAANGAATGGLRPDVTLVLDLPEGVGRARQLAAGKTGDRLDRESEAFHARVIAHYRAAKGSGVVHLDASLPADRVFEGAWGALVGERPDVFR